MQSQKLALLARSLSTTTSSAQMVKPPIQVFGLNGRYASALYSAASKMKQLDAVEKELVMLQKTFKEDIKLKELIENPTLKRNLKADAFKHLATKINLSAATGNFLMMLAENGRLGNLGGVLGAFRTVMAAHRGQVTCEVTSAKPLDAAQKQMLEAALKKFLKPNETLQLTTLVDPALIGGLVVAIEDKYVDMSVASKIKRYTDVITHAV